jgi:tRNA/rRNA methyltransferase
MTTPSAAETKLSRIRVVLVHTTHPGNIGAAARAMMTMGLSNLVLVQPRLFPDARADAMATSGASEVLRSARVCATLDEALADCTYALALTARLRELAYAPLNAREAALELAAEADRGDVALVFGTEMSGLSNEEVLKCNRSATIPANAQYSSLNLAAAVQVMAYEIRMAILGGAVAEPPQQELARNEDVEMFYEHLQRNLIAADFLDPVYPKRLMERLRRLFGRTRLEKEEVNILRGILTAWDKFIGVRGK